MQDPVVLSAALVGSMVVVGFVVGWYAGDHSGRDWLLAFGGSAELFGLLLVAAPELHPVLKALGRSISGAWEASKRRVRIADNAIRTRLGLKRRGQITVDLEAATSRASAGALSVLSISSATSLEGKVEFLLRRDEETQKRLSALGSEIAGLPARWESDIEEASNAMRSEQAQALRELSDRHIQQRLLGVVLLIVGIVLATAGNLV